MNEAKYPSKERVIRDDVLIYAEGDDIPFTDIDELARQGYDPDTGEGARTVVATERIERDGVLLYAEGDVIPADVAEQLGIKATAPQPAAEPEPAPAKAKSTGATKPRGTK